MTTFPLPAAALNSDIAILGKKGGGKTFTAKGIVERLLDEGRRVLVLDPLGVWAGLRTSANGKAPGYPIAIFGGEHADLPLEPGAAEAMAGILARENVPAVVDLSDLSKSAQVAFLTKFLRELRRVNTEALTLVLEEADVFAPQNPLPETRELLGEVDWIARRGRSRGFLLITVTQRPAKLHKDVLTQCETMIVHRLPAPQDRDAVKAWVDGNGDRDLARQVYDTLAGLNVGEAWVYQSGAGVVERVTFPKIKTLDTSSTPKAGERRVAAKTLADVDLTAIRAALAAATSHSGPEIRSKKGSAPPDAKALQEAEERGFERGVRTAAAHVGNYVLITGVGTKAGERIIETDDRQRVGALFARDILGLLNTGPASREIISPSNVVPKISQVQKTAAKSVEKAEMGAERRILAVLARCHPAGMTEAQWAVASGMKRTGGTWSTYKSRLRSAGAIERRGEQWFVTADGLQNIGGEVAPMPAPGMDLVEFWIDRIPGVGPMLRVLAKSYPGGFTRGELAVRLAMSASGGTFATYLSRLSSAELISKSGNQIRASKSLMEGP